MPTPTIIKTLTLSLDTSDVTCELTGARLEPSYAESTINTFCGSLSSSVESWALIIDGLQTWGDATSVCDLLWEATDAGTDVAFELEVGPDTFSGTVSPKRTVVGGDASGPFSYSVTLPVQGNVTKAATPAGP
jgi:hypothetical protein